MVSPRHTSPLDRVATRLRRVPLVYAGFTALAITAWLVVGDTWWLQPVSLATFWWTLPGLVLTVGVGSLGFRRAAVWFALPALVWVWSYGTLFLPSSFPDTAPDLRVVSYNTYVHAPSMSSLVTLVDETRPDVLLLQEVFPEREAALGQQFGDRFPFQASVQSRGVGGVVVLSRHPILEQQGVAMTEPGTRDTLVAVLDVDGRPVQVVPVHLTSPCPTCGTSTIERLDLEGRRRPQELATVLEALDSRIPAIIGGDFNSNDRSEPYRLLTRAGFEDPHRAAGRGPGFTWPNDWRFPFLRVDWVLTRGLEAVDAWVGDGGASDHRPVIVDMTFPETRQ